MNGGGADHDILVPFVCYRGIEDTDRLHGGKMGLDTYELGYFRTGWIFSVGFKVSPYYVEVRTENDKGRKVEGAGLLADGKLY